MLLACAYFNNTAKETMLAISTMWNVLQQPDGAALFDELKDLGFEVITLSRNLTLEQVDQLKPKLKEIGQEPPCAVQNFCPILHRKKQTEDNALSLSSLDNNERKEAIRRTVQTMELATEMEIPNVLLHLGEVETYDRSYLMTELYEYGEREFEAFSKKVTEATEWRKRKEAKHQDAVLRSLDELNERALRMQLCIAIENCPQYYQIPNFDEVSLFFQEFYGSPMRYWHNVGHAAMQQKLGLCQVDQWMQNYQEHTVGVSLHDLQELEAYHPPGTGDLEWNTLWTQIPANVYKVIEVQHGDAESITQAKELCESLMNTKNQT